MKKFHIISVTTLQYNPNQVPQEPVKHLPIIPLKPLPSKMLSLSQEPIPPPPPCLLPPDPRPTEPATTPPIAQPVQSEPQGLIPIDSPPEHTGLPTEFSKSAAIENLLMVGKKSYLEKDYRNALRYYYKVLGFDPHDIEATYYKEKIEHQLAQSPVSNTNSSSKNNQQKSKSRSDHNITITKPLESTSYYNRRKKISSGRLKKPIIFSLIALILISISLIGPWYCISIKSSFKSGGSEIEGKSQLDYTLQELRVEVNSFNMTISESMSLNDEIYDDDKSIDAIKTTFIFALLALIFAILFFVIMLIGGKVSSKKICSAALLFGILTIVMGLFTPIYLSIAYPAGQEAEEREQWEKNKKALEEFRGSTDSYPEFKASPFAESFWGSESDESEFGGFTMTWGAGWGWYICFIGGILAILAVIFTGVVVKRS